MAKYLMGTLLAGFVAVMGFALTASPVEAADGCKRTKFDTELVKKACTDGGQKAAKKVMKDWVKTARKKQSDLDCKSCHKSLSPNYDLKPDGLELFKKLSK